MFASLNPLPHLSQYHGPYKVGSTEYEIPVSEIPSSTKSPDAEITTVKFRVFYPTTPTASSKSSITWLPSPQHEWKKAYASFMGLSDRTSGFMSKLPSVLSYVTIPAVQNAPILSKPDGTAYPTVIFSHGLGGNYNTYSSLIGSLASCGVVCIAPEHRDGSAPISVIRSSKDKVDRIVPYQKISHNPSPEVLNGRNAMLRIRLWELEQIWTAIVSVNDGETLVNYADTQSKEMPDFKGAMDLTPGRVTWAGHSFGSATMVQFVKSVFYNHQLPSSDAHRSASETEWDWTPIYTGTGDTNIVKQITPESPMALLDLWTMPLRHKSTEWLWKQPLPCYHRKASFGNGNSVPSVISIMSAEFHKWPEMLNRTRAVLSQDPAEAIKSLQESNQSKQTTLTADEPSTGSSMNIASRLPSSKGDPNASRESIPELLYPNTENLKEPNQDGKFTPSTRTPSPQQSVSPPGSNSPASSVLSIHEPNHKPVDSTTSIQPHLYVIPSSAHLSQSDFGPLFPNLTKYLLKAIEPEKTMELNVRAVLAMMRGQDLDVKCLAGTTLTTKRDKKTVDVGEVEKENFDRILERGGLGEAERWKKVDLKG